MIAHCLLLTCLTLSGSADDLASLDETLLLQSPAVSRDHVVFVYAQDLWVVPRRGGDARRLTSSPGEEQSPRISPDGQTVAFTAEYEGNADVYVIPIRGGSPRRLTWHPDSDVVRDWHPDGKRILFASRRHSGPPVNKLFLVGLDGSMPVELPVPKASHATYDEDATHLAYTPIADAFRTWKRYRGGRTPPVWILDLETYDVEVVPHENASDTFPCWLDGAVYFASDRDGCMNVWRYRPGSGEVEQVTHYEDFHVRNLSAGGGVLAYEQAGSIHIFDPRRGAPERLRIRVADDFVHAHPRWQSVRGHVRDADIAPNGKRAVFEARGEIITVPRKSGDPRNLTRTPGAHERSPAWSPDGEKIAYLTDESGEYRLAVRDRLGREEPRTFDLGGAPFYFDLRWSPDGAHVLFTDKGNRIAFCTIETGEITQVARVNGSLGTVRPRAVWSPDSRWIAYEARNPDTLYDHIALYSLDTRVSHRVTDDFALAGSPAFSRDGKYLFFTASVDQAPKLFGLDMRTSAARDPSNQIYVAVLARDTPNPLFPDSDEAVGDAEREGKKPKEDGDEDGGDGADETSADRDGREDSGLDRSRKRAGKTAVTRIDLEGLDQRILALPIRGGPFRSLDCDRTRLLFIDASEGAGSELKAFSFEDRETKSLAKGVRSYRVSADGRSLLLAMGSGYSISGTSGKDLSRLDIDSVRVRVDPAEEWPQILRETWRIQRDFFYDPNLHGVDWDAMWERWSAFLPHVRHRADLTLLIQELIGELCCGHQYVSGGEMPDDPDGVPVGLLGADFEIDHGLFRIARIYQGQNWNPGLRAPLTEPGVDARVGDYLLAVDGRPLRAEQNLYEAFQNTAGRQVELRLSPTPDGEGARTVSVIPISSEGGLRRASWIEENRRRVDELSRGQLAYVYMPNTGRQGMAAFDRDFYSQIDKLGVVIDERYNGGGQVADYVIDVLSREVMSYWMNRELWVGRSPFGMIDGPKVMVINEYAGSGGDWMPWTFQRRKLGPLVGKRTWGGLVGISGYPPLVDGGRVTAASFGVMDPDGNWAVENVGVSPDYEVEEWPKDVIAGRDPQLERAVELALEALRDWKRTPKPVYTPPAKR